MDALKSLASDMRLDGPGIFIFAVFIFLAIVIVLWHRDKESNFDIRYIVIDSKTENVSLSKLGQFVALVVSTSALWYEMMHGRLTEWLFIGYMMAWAGANIASKLADAKLATAGGATPPVPAPIPAPLSRHRPPRRDHYEDFNPPPPQSEDEERRWDHSGT